MAVDFLLPVWQEFYGEAYWVKDHQVDYMRIFFFSL